MRRGPGSLRRQVMLSTVAVTFSAMAVMALLVQVVLAVVVRNNLARELQNRADAVVAGIEPGRPLPDTNAGTEDRLGAGALVFDSQGVLRSGRVPRGFVAAVDRLRTTPVARTVDVEESVRLLASPFEKDGSKGVVIVAEPLTPYERSERYALYVTLLLGTLVTAGAGLIASSAVRRSLRPVMVMADRADDWSEHDLTQRFDLGPPTNELTGLGDTLDRLLDRVAVALRTEQRLTADIAHELRTPLTAILGTADLALLDEDLPEDQARSFADISAAARRLNETVTTLVEVARAPGGLAGEATSVGSVLDALADSAPTVEQTASTAERAVLVAAPQRVVQRMLAPVLDNAARYAGGARVGIRLDPSWVDLLVDDDGPGLPVGEDVFAPGRHRAVGSGAGLGLALSRRVARSCGGDVFTEESPHGARFVVRVPRP